MNIILKKNETMQNLVDRLAESFEMVSGVAPVAYWYENLNEDGRILDIHFSKRLRDMLGYSSEEDFPDELSTLMNYTHPDDVQTMLQGAIDAGTGKSDKYDVQYRVRRADGNYMWCNATGELVKDSEGRTIGMYGAFLDVSKEIERRFELGNQEIIGKYITDKLMEEYDALYIVDLDRDEIYPAKSSRVSNVGSFLERKNYRQLITDFAQTVAPRYKNDWISFSDTGYMKQYMADEDHREYIYELPEAKHSMRRFTIDVLERMCGEASILLFSFVGIDEKRAEELGRQNEALETNSMIRVLVSDFERALYVRTGESMEDDVSMVLISSKFLTSTIPGFSNDIPFVEQLDLYINNIIHPDDRERVYEETRREIVLDEIHTHTFYNVDFRTVENGEPHYAQLRFSNVADETRDYGFVIGLRRTDEEKQAELALEEALAMAQSANRAKTTFLNNMSHDIRTPMNAIIGYTGLAASHIDNKELTQDYLKKIGQSSDHLLSLINDVLDMSRIESGKMNLDEKPENLSEIMHTLRNIVQADVKAKELDFFMDTADVTDESIICDKLRLNQVLLNLLSNSIKYTQPGGTVSLRLSQHSVTESGYGIYRFCVKDNGMGMSEEFLKTIFDPFTRVKSSTVSGIQGTGLGMAITKNIVDIMGGNIEVRSKEGEGTEVLVEFKFKLGDAQEKFERIGELEGLRGLVVDDDLNACMSISKMLRDCGMRSEWCASGKEATVRTEEALRIGDMFKVFIIDWLMPDMNGIETARRIRKLVGDEAPIIILTAYDWSDIEEEAREAGVTGFISKPMFPSDLHSVLEKCIGRVQVDTDNVEKSYDFSGKKLLLVEDNEMNREIAIEILSEEGFIIDTAEDGDIAVEKVRHSIVNGKGGGIDYDVILMDIQMPRMDGYEATREIREIPLHGCHVPIIAMTANAFEEDRRAALDAGMDEHIAKPIDVRKLKETLAKFI